MNLHLLSSRLYTESKPFLITAWLNRILYILWIGWFACGTLWVFESLFGDSYCVCFVFIFCLTLLTLLDVYSILEYSLMLFWL